MRMTSRQLRQLIREEIGRSAGLKRKLIEGYYEPTRSDEIARAVIEFINDYDETDYKLTEFEAELPSSVGPSGLVDPNALNKYSRNLLMIIASELNCELDMCDAGEVKSVLDSMRMAMS